MKKLIAGVVILPLLFLTTNMAFALRYGNDLIAVGDFKIEVLSLCGQPFSKETIGYIDHVEIKQTNDGVTEKRIRVMKIEEWILEVTRYGTTYYYSLVFEGNKLTKIEQAGKKQR